MSTRTCFEKEAKGNSEMAYYHIPFFIKSCGSLKKFSGQGVERNNDYFKRVMFHKSNKWDAARDILQTESGKWDLQHHERQKGSYT